MPTAYTIRPATPDDAETVCELICALAEFEKLRHKANPSPHRLARQLAPDSSPPCGSLLAEADGGGAVGFALYYYKYSSFLTDWGVHLEDLFVRPEYRRRGIGTDLLRAVARLAVESNCGRLELSVLDWNRGALDLYEGLGAEPLSDWTTYRFSGRSLERLALDPTAP